MTLEPGDGWLPGELPDTSCLEDAEHWLTVYAELLQLATDLELEPSAGHYESRLRFWRRRHLDLESP